ncbi:alpha/beta hydrolase [Geodermatophilus sp. SYSU D01180]
MSAPGLTAVAAWDVALLDGAVWTLEAVTERLPPWRARVEEVARALGTAECWSGDAGRVAALALGEVSAVVTAVTSALGASLDRLQDAAREARTAQELAEQALAEAATRGVTVDEAGGVVLPAPAAPPAGATPQALADHYDAIAEQAAAAERVAGLAADALGAAARAAAAAAGSSGPLGRVGVVGGAPPPGYAALAAAAGAAGAFTISLRLPPAGASPDTVAAWWGGLSGPARDALLAAAPPALGGLDGVPAWVRDRVNRVRLDRTLADPTAPGRDSALAVAAEIAGEEAAGRTVQLWVYEPADDLAAVVYGDADTADDVALLVPGLGNTVADDLAELGDDARAVADATLDADPAATVAAVAWLGYRAPAGAGSWRVAFTDAAARGGAALAGDLAGLAAAREGNGPGRAGDPRVTVVAHSYGTVVVDQAADEPGLIDADAVVLAGSPGIDEEDAAGLEAPEVHAAASPWDPISYLEWFGTSPWRPGFGATGLPVDPDTLHWEYYDPDRPTLPAIGEVVARAQTAD